MPVKEFDPFAPSSGLADDFDATITHAEFGYRQNYNNGDTALLILTLKSTDGTPIGKDGDFESETIYSCGGVWEVVPGDSSKVRREDGKKLGFNRQSAIFTSFLAPVLEHDASGQVRGHGDPMDATGYIGLSFHWKRVPYGDEGKDRLQPVGPSETAPAGESKPAAGKAATAATNGAPKAAAKAAAPKAAKGGLDAVTAAKLLGIAGECDDHDAFVSRVFDGDDIEGAQENAAVVTAVLADGEGSIWANSRG